MSARSVVHVHHRGDRGVDGIMHLIELARHDGPLETMLSTMCDELAAIVAADVASIYVVEGAGEGALVMRGNHGFGANAIGTVLGVGEGITGLVAECMRPVSAAHAATEAAYKPVPGLGEEEFPVFAGIPLISGGAVVGVLVLQRRDRPFAADEVTLATALGAPVTLAIERRRASAVRAARLVGHGHGGNVVLGRAGMVPTSTAISAAPVLAPAPTGDAAAHDVERAIARLRDDLGRAVRRLADSDDPLVGAALDRFALALCDQRLRERLDDAAGQPAGLRAVAKAYARAGTDDERIAEVEELCVLIGIPPGALRPGSIWLADRIAGVVAIAAVARGASALVASAAASPTAIAIARAARLPLVTGVPGLFGWARPGDLLAVDGTSGTVLVHPSPTDIEQVRRERG